jgi:ABC-type cobalamin/Fe3+-siderophores transport system ATPase subunit
LTQAFALRDLGVRYGAKQILRGISCEFDLGEFVAIAGPNGAGKSTLIGSMSGLRRGYLGSCLFRGTEVRKWERRAFAREVSVVPQSVRIDFPFTAEQVVLMGRAPFANRMFESDEDRYQVRRVMELTETTDFRDRDFRTLSGGEKQRVIVASALAQMPTALLLDEPAAFLDIEHQIALYRLLRSLCDAGVLVLAVTHDLNLAGAYAHRVVLLRAGEIVADGTPQSVFDAATLKDVFHVHAHITEGPNGRPWIWYGS